MSSLRAALCPQSRALGWRAGIKEPGVRVRFTSMASATTAFLHHIFQPSFPPLSPSSCTEGENQRGVRTTTPRMLCFCLRSRAGWECCALQPAFPLAKDGKSGRRPVKAPSNRCTTVLLGACLVPYHSPLCSEWMRSRKGGKGKPAGALGSLEMLGDKAEQGSGEAPRLENCGCSRGS